MRTLRKSASLIGHVLGLLMGDGFADHTTDVIKQYPSLPFHFTTRT